MNPYDSTPTTPTPAAPKRRRWVTPTIAIGTLVAGFAIGSGASGVATAEAPEPEVITETITEVETVTETVEVVPAACLDALSSAEDAFDDAADFSHLVADMMTGIMVPALEAAFYQDIAGMEAATADMKQFGVDVDAITSRISASTFPIEAAQCRSAS